MLAKSSGLNAKGPSLSLEQKNFCVVLTYSIKWASEIRKFHPVVQQWLRNVQKSVIHMQSLFFCQSKPIAVVVIQKYCSHGNMTSHFSSRPMKIPGEFDPLSSHRPHLEIMAGPALGKQGYQLVDRILRFSG